MKESGVMEPRGARAGIIIQLVMTLRLFSLTLVVLLLGCGLREDPQRLLAVASNYAGSAAQTGKALVEPTDQTRLEALRALLQLQDKEFNVTLAPIKYTETTGIDHIVLMTLGFSNNGVTLLATPSRLPDHNAPEGAYWSMEELTFEKSGKLLSRQPHQE